MLPTETLLDVLSCLDRFDFDAIELSSSSFRPKIAASTDRLPLRSIRRCIWDYDDLTIYASAPYEGREIAEHSYAVKIIPLFVAGLRHCYVQELVLESVDTDALNVLPETFTEISGVIQICRLVLRCMDFADAKVDTLFGTIEALRHVEYVDIDGGCYAEEQLSDEFLRICADNDVKGLKLDDVFLESWMKCKITDEGFIAFLKKRRYAKPVLCSLKYSEMSNSFVRRVLEACERGELQNNFSCTVECVSFDQDLGKYTDVVERFKLSEDRGTLVFRDVGLQFMFYRGSCSVTQI